MDPASLLIFYGTYFGVLGRDLSEICADKMAATIGVSWWFVVGFGAPDTDRPSTILVNRMTNETVQG